MLAQALREVRYHPGRLVATLLAIALSVGFMSAVSVFMATQTAALGKMTALPTSRADLVVDMNSLTQSATVDAVRAAMVVVPGVDVVEQAIGSSLSLAKGDASAFVSIYSLPGERFRWAGLSAGAWPSGSSELAISEQLAGQLGAKVGDVLEGGQAKFTVVGITADAPTLYMQTAYAAPSATMFQIGEPVANGSWRVALKPGADVVGAKVALDGALAPYRGPKSEGPDVPEPITVLTAAQAQHEASMVVGRDFDVMKYMLLGFSGVAALVGMIIIANTFTILLAQRRRQIGLLRAVGASGGQVRGRFLAEAVVLGVIGSLLGIALGVGVGWVGAIVTKASWFGLVIPWTDLAVEVGVGVLLTVLAAMVPALRTTRVAPLEALQPVATSEQVRRASRVRAVLTGVLFIGGVALAVLSQRVVVDPEHPSLLGPMLYAVAGSVLITIAVLGAAPLYIPVLLKGFGRLVGRTGATARLAADNAVRNPSRAAATATALMLATGLIVTLQIGVATAQRTVLSEIEKRMPIDVTVSTPVYAIDPTSVGGGGPLPRLSDDAVARATKLSNVKSSVVLNGGGVTFADRGPVIVVGADPAMRNVSDVIDVTPADGVLLTSAPDLKDSESLTLTTASGAMVKLTAKKVRWVPPGQGVVSKATLARLVASPQPQTVWLKVADKDQIGATMRGIEALTASSATDGPPAVEIGGSAAQSYLIKQVLDILLLVTTALLGVAVLIALIGVGNTLGLSVIERARESALLRALGMQRGSLRVMLLVEALLLALTGILVGVAAGVFFGWLGMTAIVRESGFDVSLQLGVDWAQTAGMIAIGVAAAALASVLPGRRAANATPTEALAAD